MTVFQQEQGTPRNFAYGNTPTHEMTNVHPDKVAEGDTMKHLGKWCTVTQNITKPDGSHVIYFKELSHGALIPMVIPEGTGGVTVIRAKRYGGAEPKCATCGKPNSLCVCNKDEAQNPCSRCGKDNCICDID